MPCPIVTVKLILSRFQVRIRREEQLQGDTPTQLIPHWSTKPVEQSFYQPTVVSTDITYIEVDSEVDSFIHRLEVRVLLYSSLSQSFNHHSLVCSL